MHQFKNAIDAIFKDDTSESYTFQPDLVWKVPLKFRAKEK